MRLGAIEGASPQLRGNGDRWGIIGGDGFQELMVFSYNPRRWHQCFYKTGLSFSRVKVLAMMEEFVVGVMMARQGLILVELAPPIDCGSAKRSGSDKRSLLQCTSRINNTVSYSTVQPRSQLVRNSFINFSLKLLTT